MAIISTGDELIQPGQTMQPGLVYDSNARILADAKGPKIRASNYKNKSNQRRRWGHRQHLAEIEITGITRG